jgi:hypothetical protein
VIVPIAAQIVRTAWTKSGGDITIIPLYAHDGIFAEAAPAISATNLVGSLLVWSCYSSKSRKKD